MYSRQYSNQPTSNRKPAFVLLSSESLQDRYGEEYLGYFVSVCDEDGEPVGKVYNPSTRQRAIELADKIARDRRLPIEQDLHRM